MADPDPAPPKYLDEIEDQSEAVIRQRIGELEGEIKRLTETLEQTRKAKQILYLSDAALRDELVRFLADTLGMPAKADGGNKQQFWLVAAALGEEWGFGEIRESPAGNVTREHLAHMMIDRETVGRPEEFPAMLVVNTFFQKENLEERDQPVSPEVTRRASEDHIMVVRTLDLVRLRQKEQSGFAGIQEFMESVRNGGGWYEVNAQLSSQLHQG
ncbi:MAG: hypothetical protein WD276_02000 [Actinomycetota bacterium]